jgi:hypothetical protein
MPEPVFFNLRMYIVVPEPIWMAYFINRCHHSACLSLLLSLLGIGLVKTFLRQRIHEKNESCLEAFSMRSVPYQRRAFGFVCASPYRLLGNGSVNAFPRQNYFWRRLFRRPWRIKGKYVIFPRLLVSLLSLFGKNLSWLMILPCCFKSWS